MILAIDCGNTRLKWGLYEDGARRDDSIAKSAGAGPGWRAVGAVTIEEMARLATDWASLPTPVRVVISNVAGMPARQSLMTLLARFEAEPLWISAQRTQCGVTNGYTDPGQLGPDRWAALVGAWHLHRGACLVVTAGTATTVDILSAQGVHRGGIIVAGVDLMKRALARNTARLELEQGRFAHEPRSTADAIETGCLHAQAGAVERMYSNLESGGVCLLSGGNAARIMPLLNIPVRAVDNLALEGLVRIGT